MTFRKVELVAVECDTCGERGPAHSRDHYAEQLAAEIAKPILPLKLGSKNGAYHVCVACRKAIAAEVAS